ncbi:MULTISPECIES: ATP-grasp domain-containing protein [unclassified Microbacterium]|uniref:ATP-grasp domain-containing protein n=1 Tax=unclassified Microbacterium TaxID=2609290 RepID=UPI00301866DA
MPSSPLIGIVVTDAYAPEDPDHDTPLLLEALRARGKQALPVVWHDEDVDLAAFSLLVIRSPWDYPERPADFDAWLTRAQRTTRVVNDPAIVRWNLDKRYLAELDAAGIRTVPTVFAATLDTARAAIAAQDADGAARVVIKPTVSAGARDTGLFAANDPAALDLAARIIAGGGVAMVQPEVPELSAGREKALYAIDGAFTHAIAKGALLEPGGGLRGGVYAENPVPVPTSDEERAFAADVLAAVRAVTGSGTPVYARIDTVDSERFGLCVLEVELVEPALNLHVAPRAIDAVVDAILAAVDEAASGASESTP